MIIVNGFQPLTIITKPSIFDVAAALDLPLTKIYEIVVYKHAETVEYVRNTSFRGKYLENSHNQKCEIFRVLFLDEHKQKVRSPNLY